MKVEICLELTPFSEFILMSSFKKVDNFIVSVLFCEVDNEMFINLYFISGENLARIAQVQAIYLQPRVFI